MKSIHIFALLIFSSLLASASLNGQTAAEILKKSEEKIQGNSAISEITISIVRPRWTRDIDLKTWSKGEKYSATLITAPKREKGTVFLKRDKEIWNWVPSIEQTVKMPPSMMTQSWMGTDFSTDDLVRLSSTVNDFDQKILADEEVLGRACHKLELIATESSAVVWGKIVIWIDKEEFMQLKTEFYDEEEYLVNTIEAKEIGTFDGQILPSIIEIVPAEEEDQKTIMQIRSMKFNADISDDIFTVDNMKNLN